MILHTDDHKKIRKEKNGDSNSNDHNQNQLLSLETNCSTGRVQHN